MEREDLDDKTFGLLRAEVDRRLDSSEAAEARAASLAAEAEGAPLPRWKKVLIEIGRPLDAALSLHQSGCLDSLVVTEAMSEGDDHFVLAALAVMADIPFPVARKIVDMQSAKGMVALAWKAGVPERLLAPLQNRLCRVAPDEVLKPARGFPLTVDEMVWQLEFFNQIAGKG
jgi:hypothetical protein